MLESSALQLHGTSKFSVLGEVPKEECKVNNNQYPVISLEDLLLHQSRGTTQQMAELLWQALKIHGFCLLVTPLDSRPAKVIADLRHHLNNQVFPTSVPNSAQLQTSAAVYFSEKNIPMYHLGYELCEDSVREVFRIAAGYPDKCPWLDCSMRRTWLRALGLMRDITDTALDLVMESVAKAKARTPLNYMNRQERPFSSRKTWVQDDYFRKYNPLPERDGDYSVLYAMHYFNDQAEVEPGVAVKAHVDPSLFVLEPFLCHSTTGLQVRERRLDQWLDCDGPDSPLLRQLQTPVTSVHGVLLFMGKALAHATGLEPTLHRVVAGTNARKTVVYEQKYEEYYPPPTLD
jgi:hypothetical protein